MADIQSPLSGPTTRPKACERCWRRKQRCDRLLPACTACHDLGLQCEARTQDHESLPSEVTHASIHSYVESLKRRLSTCQGPGETSQPRSKRARLASTEDRSPSTAQQNAAPEDDDAAVRDTVSAIGQLTNSAMADAPMAEDKHRLSPLQAVLAALAVSGESPSAAAAPHDTDASILLPDGQIPFARERTIGHMQRFLDWSWSAPHVDQDQFLDHFEAVVAKERDVAPLAKFNAYMAVATGMAMSRDADRLGLFSTSLHAAAVKLLTGITNPCDALHCIVMLTLFATFSPAGGSAWHLMGMAIRSCIELGLHKATPEADGAETPREGYHVRWLFWTVYIHDRALCCAMDRPFGIRECDVLAGIPRHSQPSLRPEAVQKKEAVTVGLIRHAQLLSSIRGAEVRDPFVFFSNARFWQESTPLDRLLPGGAACSRQLLVRALHQIADMACQSRAAATTPRGSSWHDMEADAAETCRLFIDAEYAKGRPSGSFLDAYDLLWSAVVLARLATRLEPMRGRLFAQAVGALNKAASLVAELSGRFPALRTFHQLLLKLSAHLLHTSGGADPRDWQPDQGIGAIPAMVPRGVRRMIADMASAG